MGKITSDASEIQQSINTYHLIKQILYNVNDSKILFNNLPPPPFLKTKIDTVAKLLELKKKVPWKIL